MLLIAETERTEKREIFLGKMFTFRLYYATAASAHSHSYSPTESRVV